MTITYQKAYFLLSVADVKQLPPDEGVEVAIVGRSNSGKSSVLNRLTQNKRLARVSKTPGRTQMINIFVLDEKRRLADLPGYGYAKAPLAAQKKWQNTIDNYLHIRQSLTGMVVVMDIRHPLTPLDQDLLSYCEQQNLAVHIILNKLDKLSKTAVSKTLQQVKAALKNYSNSITVQAFSALKGIGIEELRKQLDKWYN
ncbi:MAG: YihA family ribosome biogenesis GTP-binding protein [Gammaproteobacteria bacterium RIFCSPHIGHO2_12_FULL_37_14]|nr:MAG: YihA family ribosome biogenesis GTP-binding protein [Gammaproteobacteria bacterium RIFCSPHIGHO2_12_FULL_37_14]